MLIEMFRNFTEAGFEENRLLLSSNPLMCMALSAEILTQIANARQKFFNECNGLKSSILELGKIYKNQITSDAYFEDLILDTDFSNRSVLKIITLLELEQLMSEEDMKSENIMNTIFVGKEVKKCDGDILGYSNFLHILQSAPPKPHK